MALVRHRHTYQQIDRFVATSSAMRDSLLGSGVTADRVAVKPNFVTDPGRGPEPPQDRHFVFVGRLDDEKGVRLLLVSRA